MRIAAIREKTVPLASQLRNAIVGHSRMTASALVIVTDVVHAGRPVMGLAFDSPGRFGHGRILMERFAERILEAPPEAYLDDAGTSIDPFKLWALAMQGERPGGHGERAGAVGLLDAAAWDLAAKLAGKPLWRLLADRFNEGGGDGRVAVYATGAFDGLTDDFAGLQDEIRRFLDLGYIRVKIKLGGASLDHDCRRIDAALAVLNSSAALAVDCNAALSGAAAEKAMARLDAYGLAWIEEPVEPLDYELHRAIAGSCATPIAVGENIFSAADTLNLLRYGGLRADRDLLQMDISLSYGIVEYLRILNLAAARGWSRRRFVPHAGHVLSLHAAAGLSLGCHEAAPNPDSPIGGFPAGVSVVAGHVRLSDAPGAGIEETDNLYAIFRDLL